MKAVGVRELKNRLSEYLRAVREGERVLVTDRGQVVAELRAPGALVEDGTPPGILDLVRRGAASLGIKNDPDAYPQMPSVLPEGEAARLLEDERGE
jgi:antitoxin (DNA-binding transcriptional repressor) of toxin-antitoxin stability system